nr:VCBS domain-containing protein [Pseudomonas insulae]
MQNKLRSPVPNRFRPQSQAIALEPRILFDGAAAAAVDQQHSDPAQPSDNPTEHATPTEAHDTPAPAPNAARHLLVLDSRVENREQLVAQLPSDVTALVVNSSEDGLAAISAALAELGQVDSIQILSHGEAGQFTLGNRTVSADNIGQLGQTLQQWRDHLSADADIQLYGCDVGAGSAGQTLVNELARWTGTDVAASDDDTGGQAAGGDWDLEVRNGTIDKPIALSAEALAGYVQLLAAGPNTDLSGGADVLLGGTFTFTVNFSNISADAGYAPFIDLFLPTTGRDGAGAEIDDGISFVSASYLGQTLVSHVLTFDANGQASHPLAVGTDGLPLIINAADFGMRAGDQMVVLELPFSSVSLGQPPIVIQVTASLSDLADTDFSFSGATPDLTIRARSGFQYGNDSLNNPSTDPSILEPAANADSYVVHPTVISFTETVTTPEGETATGPNYGRELNLTVTPANSQPFTNVVITQPVPDNVIVTAITPGAGGVITSITLYDGRTTTDPTIIQAALALNNDADLSNDLYIREFTVLYANLSGPTTTNVQFFVPDDDADGVPVLNPITGDDVTITFGAPTATGLWRPLDPRDEPTPGGSIIFSGTGNDTSFIAKSITLLKQVTVQTDVGATGLSPGDVLSYQLNIAISDYFAFGKNFFGTGSLIIRDSLSDGQTLVAGSGTLTITVDGTTQSIALVTTVVTNADGTTSLALDIGQSLIDAFAFRGWLNGDLSFDDVLQGATSAVISYQATVGQSYARPIGTPHLEINEGDSLGNNATVTGTILEDPLNPTGGDESDGSTTTSTVPVSHVDIELADLNGGGAPAPGTELRPGDVVTFRLSYDLITGDYENFTLTAYLPLPLFDLSGLDLSTIWSLGLNDTNGELPTSVTLGAGNSLVFTFADKVNPGIDGARVEIDFTLTVSDQPFADQRAFNVLGESRQTTTLDKSDILSSDDITLIASVAEPVLNISHGVVSTSHGTVTGTIGSWNAPGSGGVPFTGSVTDTTAVDGSVTGIDGGDTLRLATAIENSGGGGAFDVSTRITLPGGLAFVGGNLGSANLLVYRGDGTLLTAGTHYTVDNATNTITFIDGPGTGGLLAGRPGTAADLSGANLVVITYDVLVSATIDASATLQSNAELLSYASVEGGQNFLSTPLSDLGDQQVAAPEITKVFAGGSLDASDSSAAHTLGADLVVGESMLYDIVVTLPEGTTQLLRIDDLIPAGLRLDTTFNGTGYQLITTAGGALGANFAGTITVASLTAPSGTLGGDDVDARFTFSVSSAAADNNTGNNSFVIRVRLVASNVPSNQAGAVRQNDARLSYSDSDGDTPNGATPVNRDVNMTGAKPAITIQEPTLQLTQQLLTDPGLGFDEGDPVAFSITIGNGNAGSDFDAFDIAFSGVLPTELDQLTLVSVIYTVGGVSTDISTSFSLDPTGRTLVNTGNVDIAKGGSIVITVNGVVNASGASVPLFDNLAEVRWTSLNGTASGVADPAGERTGEDGLLNQGSLNDYRRDSTLIIPVAQGIKISRVGGLPDTAAPNPTNALNENVSIGEVIRYRAAVLVPEGNNPNYELRITLDNGLTLDDLSTMRIAFISDGGLVTDLNDLITGGTLFIIGNETSPEAQFITPDLSGAAPTGVLNPIYVDLTGVDGNGNQVVTITLGNIVNGAFGGGDDGNDDDLEGIVIEFNARVANSVGNQAGDILGVRVQDVVNGTLRATSATLFENVVEPGFTGLNKQVTDFIPNPAGTIGTATVTVSFTSNGGLAAYDTRLVDSFATGSNYNLLSVTIGGTTFGPGNLPAGVSFSTTGGLTVDFTRVEVDTQISVVYTVDVPNGATIANSDAVLTWSSLPETFTSWGGTPVGVDGTASGERTGADGVGPDASTLNNYMLREGAGLGIITGTLWNDTATAAAAPNDAIPDADPVPGDPYDLAISNQAISLIWAGVDGVFGNGDDRTFGTTTDANGRFIFGVLPSGLYRIDAPTSVNSIAQFGELRMRIDTDGSTLGQINVTLGEGVSQQANSGYVELNDAPVNSLPGEQQALEDVPRLISTNGSGITVSDIDVDRDPDPANRQIQITLSVLHGILSFAGDTSGVDITIGTTPNTPGALPGSTLVLVGTIADLNDALASLTYTGNLNFNGLDFLNVQTNDLGNYGDFDGNGIPGQLTDARTDEDFLVIRVNPVNDPPTAVNDAADAVEAGGTFNSLPGIDPRGNLLDNDTDVDIDTNGDRLDVISVTSPTGDVVAVPTIGPVVVQGQYGALVIQADGAYQYIVDNTNAAVQALRLNTDVLSESFGYTISDLGIGGAALQSSAILTVTIHGANDTPVANGDEGVAIEKGGVGNTDTGKPNDTPPQGFPVAGADASGNVLDNDNDVDGGEVPPNPNLDPDPDAIDYGESKSVTGLRATPLLSPEPLTPLIAGTAIATGTYGTLTIFADGRYSYVIDDTNTDVQRLGPNDSLVDVFSYQVSDELGLNDLAELRITIVGNYDNPVASDDQASAQAAQDNTLPESNPTGNVILFPSRPGGINDPGGNGIDLDVDAADRPSTLLQVNGIRSGREAAGGIEPDASGLTSVTTGPVTIFATYAETGDGTNTQVGSIEDFGTLTINPDGSYSFDVNSDNDAIIALAEGVSINVIFTYQIVDSVGLTDTAQLVIVVTGANNPPSAQAEFALATEAGGIGNGTPGVDPGVPPAPAESVSFTDPDGDPVSVTAVSHTNPDDGTVTVGTVGQPLVGQYGSLTLNSDGSYSYVVDNSLTAVQALRLASDLLVERFTYRVTDNRGEFDEAQIVVVIRGQNDNPDAVDDSATAVEAGGVNNGTPGLDPTGNVLNNDNDVDGGEVPPNPNLDPDPDAIDYGETKAVDSVRTGAVEGSGTAGTLGSELRGTYGWLTLNADGSYSYRLDNAMAEVQALRAGNTLVDSFNYTVIDTARTTDIAVLNVTIQGANDNPVAANDNAVAVEAGGVNNNLAGIDPSGNVLLNDSDVDQFGEALSVIGVRQGAVNGSVGSGFVGTYGTLTLGADGAYTYVVDNNNPLVNALRIAGQTLSETFTYTIRDLAGATSSATLTVTIQGQNDNPRAIRVDVVAVEAGGTNNGTLGINPSDNVLDNDQDVDAGDTKTLVGIRLGDELGGGDFTTVTASQGIAGLYGTLTVAPNGQSQYVLNNDLAAVQALKPGDTLEEVFSYRMRDTLGALSIARIHITIQGAWDAPVATNNVGIAVADNGDGRVINPSGNVLPNDTDVDQGDRLSVTAIRTGQEAGTGTAGTVGTVLVGQYGTLVLNTDGSYQYTLDISNPDVLALDFLQTLVDRFTYQATDLGGLTDLAQLDIIVIGRNDAPDGFDDEAQAIEAGGLNNGTLGLDPSGNVLDNDTDLEGGPLAVTAIRVGPETGSGASGTLGTALRGLYGDLTINADGSWTYVVDNSLAAVQALRVSGQTLLETFTYTVADPNQADDTAELRITIDGRNDTPIAVDDDGVAVEAGGVGNATPGTDPIGNVLGNDTDVDAVALGETRQVVGFASELGATALAGQTLQGRYGSLTLNADGSYSYVVDNANPTVQALRTAGETLREAFTYRMRDTEGAESTARLNLLIQGANDAPVAVNDSAVASDQVVAPHTSGNVLPNDGDVDNADQLQVVGIRTGAEAGSGTAGTVGQPLVGRYGTLTLNADGSYTYTIDLTNPEVLAAAGLGQVLQDVFTYTINDLAGASDLAELVINLDISAPFIPPSSDPIINPGRDNGSEGLALNDVQPAIFIAPVVERVARVLELSSWGAGGSLIDLSNFDELRAESLGAGLGLVPGQYVGRAVDRSRIESDLDLAWLLGRHGRTSLSADGLLSDPSIFATSAEDMIKGQAQQAPREQPANAQTARGFGAQLQAAAQRLYPFGTPSRTNTPE